MIKTFKLNFKNIIYIILSLMFGLIIGSFGMSYYELKSYKPFSWDSPPILVNCYGKDLNEVYLNDAVKYWKSNGEEILFIENNPPKSMCNHDFLYGFIIIKKSRFMQLDSDTLALTKRKRLSFKIKASAIYMKANSFKIPYILEHEIGHALGYSHIDEVKNIMHPYSEMLSDFFIPAK